jgi:hypothetical protein
VEVLLPVVKDNLLVPRSSCGSILDREVLSGLVVEVMSPVAGLLCCSRIEGEGEGASVLSQQTTPHGFELVPYVEEEPIPLDWSQALVGDGSGGS